MKLLQIPGIIICIFSFLGCEKVSDNPKVDEYVDHLRAGQYTYAELPDFTPEDIPALLQYRNESTVITNFPFNPISSLYLPECKLGIYILWTVESIRAVEINSKKLVGRFPSQNPVLSYKVSTDLRLATDDKSQREAADAYYHWWHAIRIFNDRMQIDPLSDTEYIWH